MSFQERQRSLVGAVVEAQYDGNSFFPGKISGINNDGTFSVEFDDGDRLGKVKPDNIRLKELPSAALGVVAVEASFDGEWYLGTITAVNRDGSFHVVFEDGDERESATPDEVRLPGQAGGDGDDPVTNQERNQSESEENDSYEDSYGDDEDEDAESNNDEDDNGPTNSEEQRLMSPYSRASGTPSMSAFAAQEAVAIKDAVTGFIPEGACGPQSWLDSLASNKEALSMAPPEDRLAVLHFQMVVVSQRLWLQEMAEGGGEAPHDHISIGPGPIVFEGKGLFDLMLEMRRRAIALVRLCHEDSSLEMVQAVVNLANCYAQSSIWDVVTSHATRATQLMVKLTSGLEDKEGGGEQRPIDQVAGYAADPLNEETKAFEVEDVKQDADYIVELFQAIHKGITEQGLVNVVDIRKKFKRLLPKDKDFVEWTWLVNFLRSQKLYNSIIQKFIRALRNDFLSTVRFVFKSKDSTGNDVLQMDEIENFIQDMKRQLDFVDMPECKNLLVMLKSWPKVPKVLTEKQTIQMHQHNVALIPCEFYDEPLIIGLGWTTKKQDLDLDLSCLFLDENLECSQNNVIDYECNELPGAKHSGDNRTGKGDGEDERIHIHLNKIEEHIHHLAFTVNMYSDNHSFSEVYDSYMTMHTKDGHEMARYTLEASIKSRGVLFVAISRQDRYTWSFKAVGGPIHGKKADSEECKKDVKRLLLGDTTATAGDAAAKQTEERKIPLTWEEVLALMVSTSNMVPSDIWISDLRVAIMMLFARAQKHQDRLNEAYENIIKALQELERVHRLGTRMACQLYNIAAEVLVLQQQNWVKEAPLRRRKAAEDWLLGEGDGIFRREVKRLHEGSKHAAKQMSKMELEFRAREALIKARMARLKEKEDASNKTSASERKRMEQAFKYLEKVKDTYGDDKDRFGEDHIYYVRACLAIAHFHLANKQNEKACESLKIALEKLKRMEVFKEYAPVIVSTNFQLGRLEVILGNDRNEEVKNEGVKKIKEAIKMQYDYFSKIKDQIFSFDRAGDFLPGVAYDEPSRLFILFGEKTFKYLKDAIGVLSKIAKVEKLALDCSNKLVVVAEALHGVDSLPVAKLLKDAGERHQNLKQYGEARAALSRSYRILVMHYGRKDKQTQDLQALIRKVDKETAKVVNEDFLQNQDDSDSDNEFFT